MGEIEKSAPRSAIDKKLLRNAKRMSRVELAELTGLSPEAVATRLESLLAEKDWLTLKQEELLWAIQLEDMFDNLHERLRDVSDKNASDMVNAMAKIMQLKKEHQRDRAGVEDEIRKITQEHARMFARAYDIALGHVSEEIAAQYDVDDELLQIWSEEGLRRAAKVLAEEAAE